MKSILQALLLFAAALAASTASVAEEWPSRTVKIIVGFPAGASTDIIARIYAEKLTEHFKQPFIVENTPGAASNRAASVAAAADPDGYTLFMGTVANAISQSLFKKLTFNFERDFVPIALVGSAPTVLVVNTKLGVNSVAELIALAKSKPDQLFYASAGVGTAPHLTAEMLNQMAGIRLTHVPYKGNNEAIADLLGGRISLIFSPIPSVAGIIKDGQVKALAISSAKRSAIAPDISTLAESGLPGFDTAIWYGLLAPKGTPPNVVAAIAEVIHQVNETADIKTKLATNGAEPLTTTQTQFAAFVRDDVAKWKKVIETSNISAE